MQAITFNINFPIWARTKLAAATMGRKAYWSRASGLRLTDLPKPDLPGGDWVLCRTRMGGVCGSDLAILLVKQRPTSILPGFSSMPMILGHENVAEVAEIHSSVDPSWLGKRVCVEPTLGCIPRGIDPPCRRCAAGEFGACENFGADGRGRYRLPAGTSIGYNSRTGGSWGEYFLAHVSQLIEIPDALADEDAVLTDPLACSLHGVLRSDLTGVDKVCIFGGGILGLGVVASLRALGFAGDIDIVARHNFQAKLAKKLGATKIWTERDTSDLPRIAERVGGEVITAHFNASMLTSGYDVVYECSGSPVALGQALKFTRARGQVVLIGTTDGQGADLTPIWFQELRVIGAYGRQLEHFDDRRLQTYRLVHELMLAGKMPTAGMLTHTAPLNAFADLFTAATGKRDSCCIKAAFRFT